MSDSRNTVTLALAVGNAVSECTGYFINSRKSELKPEVITWFRNYTDLGKRLKTFKRLFNDMRKLIGIESNRKTIEVPSSEVVARLDPELVKQHKLDIKSCFMMSPSYLAYLDSQSIVKSSADDLAHFAAQYLSRRLITFAENKFGKLYLDTQPETDDATIDDVAVSFKVEHVRKIYIYFIDEFSDESREEPIFLLDNETVDDAVNRFLKDFKGSYHEVNGRPENFSVSPLIEYDRKVRYPSFLDEPIPAELLETVE